MVMVPPGMQYLYGSGEAAAASLQTYRALDTYLMARSSDRSIGHQVKSVVLAPGATLDAPKFADCGEKPLAVVDRKSVVSGKSVSVRVDLGGCRIIKKNKKKETKSRTS